MSKFFFIPLLFIVPSIAMAAPFVKDSYIATNPAATSSFQGNLSIAGDTQFGIGTGILSAINGLLRVASFKAPLFFSNNTLGVGAAGFDTQLQFNSLGDLAGADVHYVPTDSGVALIGASSTASFFQLQGTQKGEYWPGAIYLQSGTFVPSGGDVDIMAGDVGNAAGNGGSVSLFGGHAGALSGNGGSVTINAGTAAGTRGNGGSLVLNAGVPSGSGIPGSIELRTASGVSADPSFPIGGGVIRVITGNGTGGVNGGDFIFTGGTGGSTGKGGGFTVRAGSGGSTAGPGGDIRFFAGLGIGGQPNGRIGLQSGASSIAFLDPSLVSGADKIYIFPNESGTFGLLSAAQTWTGSNTFSEGAMATTTVSFGEKNDSTSRVCFNTKNTDGADISFYFVGTTMVVENNPCK